MTTCSTLGCDNPISDRARLKACVNCRATMHRWLKRRPAEQLTYTKQLIVRRARMATIATLDGDDLVRVEQQVLEDRKILEFAKVTRKAKANVVALKLRARKRA